MGREQFASDCIIHQTGTNLRCGSAARIIAVVAQSEEGRRMAEKKQSKKETAAQKRRNRPTKNRRALLRDHLP